MRLCCDYRKLNAKTVPDRHPLPRIQNIIDGLGGNQYFTPLDQSKAYHLPTSSPRQPEVSSLYDTFELL